MVLKNDGTSLEEEVADLASPDDQDIWTSAEAYELYVGRWSRLVAREFVEWLEVSRSSRWLDVGCGTGALCEVILEEAAPIEIVGVDPSESYVDSLRAPRGPASPVPRRRGGASPGRARGVRRGGRGSRAELRRRSRAGGGVDGARGGSWLRGGGVRRAWAVRGR